MKIFLIMFSMACFISCQQSIPHTSKANDYREEIENTLSQQVAQWNAGSIKEFMKTYWESDSLRFITKKGERLGYHQVENNYLKHYNSKEKMGHLQFDSLNFYLLSGIDSTVNVTGKWKVLASDSSSGFFSLIFKRKNKHWKIIVDHTW